MAGALAIRAPGLSDALYVHRQHAPVPAIHNVCRMHITQNAWRESRVAMPATGHAMA